MVAAVFPYDPSLEAIAGLLNTPGQGQTETEERIDDEMIFYPRSDEEFEEMMRLMT